MDIIGQGGILSRASGNLNTIRSVSFREDCFLNGTAFSYIDYLTYGAGETKDFVVDPRNYVTPTNGFGVVIAEVPVFGGISGPITIKVYGDTIANENGTVLILYNRDGRSSKPVADTIIRLNPTVINPGVNFANYLVPSTGLNPSTGTGAVVGDVLPFNLRLDQKYLFRVTNTNGAGVLVSVVAVIYEC